MRTLLLLTMVSLIGSAALADISAPSKGRCASLEKASLQICFEKVSANIQEANIPNEVVFSVGPKAKNTLLKLMSFTTGHYADTVTVQNAQAVALVVNYQDEPRLYYYAVMADGSFKLVLAGLNMIDLPYENLMFHNDPSELYFQESSTSSILKEWIKTIYEE